MKNSLRKLYNLVVNRAVRCAYCETAIRTDPGAMAFPSCRQCTKVISMCAKCCKENCIDVYALESKVDLCPDCANGTMTFSPVK